MRKTQFWLAAIIVALALASGGTFAATTMWLSTDTTGTPIPGNTITVAPNATVQLYAFLQSDAVGNAYELMVGYDTSDATTYGPGKDTNNGASKKLALTHTDEIVGSIPASFNVFSTAGYADSQIVLDASGREASNTSLGGRPYGFVGRAATTTNAAPGKVLCFSFKLRNNMTTVNDSQYVVLSNAAGGNSFSDAWKYGTSLAEASYALNVVCGSAVQNPTVGTSGKTLRDALTAIAASNYNWVLWGTVFVIDANTFTINDGSGVTVKVIKSSHGRINGDYVSVRGTLNMSTNPPTLTAQQVIKRN